MFISLCSSRSISRTWCWRDLHIFLKSSIWSRHTAQKRKRRCWPYTSTSTLSPGTGCLQGRETSYNLKSRTGNARTSYIFYLYLIWVCYQTESEIICHTQLITHRGGYVQIQEEAHNRKRCLHKGKTNKENEITHL